MAKTTVWLLIGVVLLSLGLQQAGRRHNVAMQNLSFNPNALTINVGDQVVWTNHDDRDYNVVAADGSFNSGDLKPRQTFTWRFTKAGTHPYSCTLHPRMRGTITVKE